MALKSTPLSLLWLMFCAMINASDPTFHLFCGFKYPPSCFCVCWKIKMQIRSMKQVNFVNSSIHYSELKYPPSCFSVYLENKNAYMKQETSEIVVKSIHHGGLLFNCIIINLKSSENKERWRLSTISIGWFKSSRLYTSRKIYNGIAKLSLVQYVSMCVSHSCLCNQSRANL